MNKLCLVLFFVSIAFCQASGQEAKGVKLIKPSQSTTAIQIKGINVGESLAKLEAMEETALYYSAELRKAFETWFYEKQNKLADDVWNLAKQKNIGFFEKLFPKIGSKNPPKDPFGKPTASGAKSGLIPDKPLSAPAVFQTLIISDPTRELSHYSNELSKLDAAIELIISDLWKNVAFMDYQQKTRLMISDFDRKLRGDLGPMISDIPDMRVPECENGLIGSASVWKHMLGIVNRDFDPSIIGLSMMANQSQCSSIDQMRAFEAAFYYELISMISKYRKAVGLKEGEYDKAQKEFIGAAVNPMLMAYDGNKRVGWAVGQQFFCKFIVQIIEAFNEGGLGEFGLGFHDYMNGAIDFPTIIKTDITKFKSTCSEVTKPIIKDGYTQFGADMMSLKNACNEMESIPKPPFGIGDVLNNITDVNVVGMMFRPFGGGGMWGARDKTGLCGGGGGGKGGGGSAPAMACSYGGGGGGGGSSGGNYSCSADSSEVKGMPMSGSNAALGGQGPGGNAPTPADTFEFKNLKIGDFCLGKLGEPEPPNPDGALLDPKAQAGYDKLSRKYAGGTAQPASEENKKAAKDVWDSKKNDVYSSYEKTTGETLSNTDKAAMDATVYKAIDQMQQADFGSGGVGGMASPSGQVLINTQWSGPELADAMGHELTHVALWEHGVKAYNADGSVNKIKVEGGKTQSIHHSTTCGAGVMGCGQGYPNPNAEVTANKDSCSIYSMWANGSSACVSSAGGCRAPLCDPINPPGSGEFDKGQGGQGGGGIGTIGMGEPGGDPMPEPCGGPGCPSPANINCDPKGGMGAPSLKCTQDDCYPTMMSDTSLVSNPGAMKVLSPLMKKKFIK